MYKMIYIKVILWKKNINSILQDIDKDDLDTIPEEDEVSVICCLHFFNIFQRTKTVVYVL